MILSLHLDTILSSSYQTAILFDFAKYFKIVSESDKKVMVKWLQDLLTVLPTLLITLLIRHEMYINRQA